MAIAANNDALVEAYSTRFLEKFHNAAVFSNGTNRFYEGQMQNAESIRIPKDDTTYTTGIATSATFQFPNPQDNTVSTVLVEWDDPYPLRRFIRVDHEAELAPSLVLQSAEQTAIAYAETIDKYIYGKLTSLTVPASRTITVGADNNYVSDGSGRASGTSANAALVWNGIRAASLKLEQSALAGLAARIDRGFDVFAPPHIRMQLENYLLSLGVDSITTSIIGGQSMTSILGRYRVWSTNVITEISPSGTDKDYYPVWITNRAATTFGTRFTHQKIWEPGSFIFPNNQYGYMLDNIVQPFCKVVVPELIYQLQVRSEA